MTPKSPNSFSSRQRENSNYRASRSNSNQRNINSNFVLNSVSKTTQNANNELKIKELDDCTFVKRMTVDDFVKNQA